MAEITTHIFMAKEVQNKLNCNDSIKYFSVGPDAFFFSRKTRKLGYEMHRNKTFLFFKNYINYIKDNNLENNDFIVCSLYGFLCHYVLDYMVHPYVFYFDHLNKDMHRKIEMCLTKNVLLNKSIMPNEFKINKEIKKVNNKELINLLDEVIYNTYGYKKYGKKYIKCLKNMKLIYSLFRHDKYGFKKSIYRKIDKLFNKKTQYISFYNISDVDMNFKHSKWNHPCVKDEKHTESLIELYNDSINILIDMIHRLNFNMNDKELKEIIDNKSYITGKDCDDRFKIQYFSSKIDI